MLVLFDDLVVRDDSMEDFQLLWHEVVDLVDVYEVDVSLDEFVVHVLFQQDLTVEVDDLLIELGQWFVYDILVDIALLYHSCQVLIGMHEVVQDEDHVLGKFELGLLLLEDLWELVHFLLVVWGEVEEVVRLDLLLGLKL